VYRKLMEEVDAIELADLILQRLIVVPYWEKA
jgi:hypothetical protein